MKDDRGTLVRVKSHRAWSKMERVMGGQLECWFVFMGHNDYVFVPDDKLDAALAITSVGRARLPKQLQRCWG